LPIAEGSGVLLRLSDETSSVEALDVQGQIQVYPNPVKDNLHVYHSYIKIGKYELYNVLGELIKDNQLNCNNIIDFSTVVQGVYYLRVNTQYGVFTYKIVKN
jgi:hypothetical protein